MGRVTGVLDNPPGFSCTPPGVDILEGGKLTSNNVAGSSQDPLQSPAVASSAVSKPGGDSAGQDALHSAGVEGSEDAFIFKNPYIITSSGRTSYQYYISVCVIGPGSTVSLLFPSPCTHRACREASASCSSLQNQS